MNKLQLGPPYQIITRGSGENSQTIDELRRYGFQRNGPGNPKQDICMKQLIITLVALNDFLLQLHFKL